MRISLITFLVHLSICRKHLYRSTEEHGYRDTLHQLFYSIGYTISKFLVLVGDTGPIAVLVYTTRLSTQSDLRMRFILYFNSLNQSLVIILDPLWQIKYLSCPMVIGCLVRYMTIMCQHIRSRFRPVMLLPLYI